MPPFPDGQPDPFQRQTADERRPQGKYEELVEAIDGVVWEADARTFQFTFVSRQAEKLLGYSAAQWLAEHDFWPNHIHPDDRDQAVSFCLTATREGRDHDFEYRMLAADGRVVWVRDIVTLSSEGGAPTKLRGIMVDVTAQRRTEERLREREAERRLALEVGQLGDWHWDVVTREVVWSPLCKALYGLPPDADVTYEQFLAAVHPDDRERVAAAHRQSAETGADYEIEKRVVWPDGSVHWNVSRARVVRDPAGRPVRMTGVTMDVTERRRAEAALAASERHYRLLFERNMAAVLRNTTDGTILNVNDAFARMFGYESPADVLGQKVGDLYHDPADRDVMLARLRAEGTLTNYELRFKRRDGRVLWALANIVLYEDQPGRPVIQGTIVDVTERKSAEAERQRTAALLRAVADGTPDAVFVKDRDSRYMLFNTAAGRFVGLPPEEVIGNDDTILFDPTSARAILDGDRRVIDGETAETVEETLTAVGVTRTYLTTKAPYRDESGRVIGLIGIARDITERKRAEDALRDSEQRFRTFVDHATDAFFLHDDLGVIRDVNQRACESLGYSRDELIGMLPTDVDADLNPDRSAEIRRKLAAGETTAFDSRHRRKDGSAFPVEVRLRSFRVGDRRFGVALVRDITDRKRAEDALRDSQKRLQAIAATMPHALYVFDIAEQRNVFTNREIWHDLGYTNEEIDGMGRGFMAQLLHPDDLARVPELLARWDTAKDGEILEVEYRMRTRRGEWRWFLGRDAVYQRAPDGRVLQIIGTAQDITARKHAEDERRKLEAQLQHAQKLESLGVLAGGIAHDFNNLLTSILGYTDLARLELPPGSAARELLAEAAAGTRRAAELTKQMLAYSGKGRFVVEPLNLSVLVEEMTRLLQISISKKCVVKFSLMSAPPAIEADAAQVRQIVMNLIINASDAIGDRSGVIAITTGVMHCDQAYLSESYLDENLSEGLYTYLEVADDGCGMSEDIRGKIFDPFFTTKFTGRGLGLSAVLGIVRGHRAAIKCYSEPGKGTTFKVLFPATDLPAEGGMIGAPVPQMWCGTGTVLVVDDEESIRGLARRMLETMGFTVLTAADGRAGVEAFRGAGTGLRLVLLDLTMPHLDGEETFREMRRLRGDVKAVLSSGYNEQSATSRFAGKGLAGFIQKPYGYEELLAVVRAVLGE